MTSTVFSVGQHLVFPDGDRATVTFVGVERIGLKFDDGAETLITVEALQAELAASPAHRPEEPSQPATWPASTFVPEASDARHYCGSHWDPFAESSADILKTLPDMLAAATVQTGYGDVRPAPRAAPDGWAKGVLLAWPAPNAGLTIGIRADAHANNVVEIYPHRTEGSQHTLRLNRVLVWERSVAAQIEADWSPGGSIAFFDIAHVIDRGWYEAGMVYDFLLAGIAYDAQIARTHEIAYTRNADEVAWMNLRRAADEPPIEAASTLYLDGCAMLVPVDDWDIDDYQFRGPVVAVTPFDDWLGQSGWRVRTTVMRGVGDEPFDLDIYVTRKAWRNSSPPEVGCDMEGRLWLQGRLWMPHRSAQPTRRPSAS